MDQINNFWYKHFFKVKFVGNFFLNNFFLGIAPSLSIETERKTDMITLTGWGMRSIWQFQISQSNCPDQGCTIKLKNRSVAMSHFKKVHALNSVLCHICNIPILINPPINYKRHFQRFHPHMKMPQKYINMMQQKIQQSKKIQRSYQSNCCKVCGKLVRKENLNRHMTTAHESKRVYCPLIECNFSAKEMRQIREHWLENHELMFPGYWAKTTSNDPDEDKNENERQSSSVGNVDSETEETAGAEFSLLKPIELCSSRKSSSGDDSSICLV